MSKQNSIIIILVTLVLVGSGLLFFYFKGDVTTTQTTPTTPTGITGNIFGSNELPTTTGQGTTTQIDGTTTQTNLTKLTHLYRTPTSGSVFFLKNDGQNLLRFVDRRTGNTYEYDLENGFGEPVRITNTTVPKIQEAIWSSNGGDLVLRYLDNDTDTIISFLAQIKTDVNTPTSPEEITGSFLPTMMQQIVISPNGNNMFALFNKLGSTGTYGTMYSFANITNGEQIFDSPISYWNIDWPINNIITFNTKPTYKDYGFLYTLNTQTGGLRRILGNIVGLSSIMNSDGTFVAYSQTTNGQFNLNLYNIQNQSSERIQTATLADKCVWGLKDNHILYCAVPKTIPSNIYPDAWYQGVVSFSDTIWKIDTQIGSTEQIYELGVNEDVNIDVIDIKINQDDSYISFVNKNDLSLWLLEL